MLKYRDVYAGFLCILLSLVGKIRALIVICTESNRNLFNLRKNKKTMVQDFSSHFLQVWNSVPARLPDFPAARDKDQKRERELQTDHFIRSVKQIARKRKLKSGITVVDEERFFAETRNFFQQALEFDDDQANVLFSDEMVGATRAFVSQVRKFDPLLSFNDVFQALRNAWIMFGVQFIFNYPVRLTPSIFAYSMLYPYTDNLIDNPGISPFEKLAFSSRFHDRLSGKSVKPLDPAEQKIYALVEMIEQEFPRADYPEVFDSLLAIHDAQTSSLQLLGPADAISRTDALKICILKGGTSVLADGFLVAGKLTTEQQVFLYGYGSYLQMLDDIQDVSEDFNSGLKTYFAQEIGHRFLDWKVRKTYQFGAQVMESLDRVQGKQTGLFKSLIRRSMDLFVAEAIAQNPEFYSPGFARTFEKHSPFNFSYIRKLNSQFPVYHGILVTAAKEIAVPQHIGVYV